MKPPGPVVWCHDRPQQPLSHFRVDADGVVRPGALHTEVVRGNDGSRLITVAGQVVGRIEPPQKMATRPQDWAEPARSILFGPDAATFTRAAWVHHAAACRAGIEYHRMSWER
jgi:hypothetical protein